MLGREDVGIDCRSIAAVSAANLSLSISGMEGSIAWNILRSLDAVFISEAEADHLRGK